MTKLSRLVLNCIANIINEFIYYLFLTQFYSFLLNSCFRISNLMRKIKICQNAELFYETPIRAFLRGFQTNCTTRAVKGGKKVVRKWFFAYVTKINLKRFELCSNATTSTTNLILPALLTNEVFVTSNQVEKYSASFMLKFNELYNCAVKL